jgi:pyruvate/2-oxoglutarate dehydrogenase complex dihydrolipoamide dehydrogenase (E3) component
MVGSRVVILGSGDIGLIMARRMTLEGARVEGVFELLPYASGLQRNIHQCLNDYGIPLHLSTTVTRIHGRHRVTGVSVAQVDEKRRPIPETERLVPCDTLLLSVGLIPENELSTAAGVKMAPGTNGAVVDEHCLTSTPGVFSCGNVLHVHDLVDHVSEEAARAGAFAAKYLDGETKTPASLIPVEAGPGVRYVLPQQVEGHEDFILSLRVAEPSRDRTVRVRAGGRKAARKKAVRLHPAEMVRIKVKAENIRDAERLEVVVE